MERRPRPTAGLSYGERTVFWRVLGACCLDEPGFDTDEDSRMDVEEHARNIARTAVRFQARPARRKVAA